MKSVKCWIPYNLILTFKLTELKYNCCTYNENLQKTTESRLCLKLNMPNIGLFKACISRIWISHFCTIEVEFINKILIKNITERKNENAQNTEFNDNYNLSSKIQKSYTQNEKKWECSLQRVKNN